MWVGFLRDRYIQVDTRLIFIKLKSAIENATAAGRFVSMYGAECKGEKSEEGEIDLRTKVRKRNIVQLVLVEIKD